LSGVVHGEYDEEAGLKNFEALHRLVIGILENVINHKEVIGCYYCVRLERRKR